MEAGLKNIIITFTYYIVSPIATLMTCLKSRHHRMDQVSYLWIPCMFAAYLNVLYNVEVTKIVTIETQITAQITEAIWHKISLCIRSETLIFFSTLTTVTYLLCLLVASIKYFLYAAAQLHIEDSGIPNRVVFRHMSQTCRVAMLRVLWKSITRNCWWKGIVLEIWYEFFHWYIKKNDCL